MKADIDRPRGPSIMLVWATTMPFAGASGQTVRRREFIKVVAGCVAAWPVRADAQQQSAQVRQIGVLMPFAENDAETRAHVEVFRKQLQQLGWTEGRNVRIILRWGAGDLAHIQKLAKELVELRPDVILSRSTPVTKAILGETTTIPVVFVVVSDPVGDGIVASIARPGGNVTGFTNVEASLGGKWVEVLKEMCPTIARVAILFDPKASPGGGKYYLQLIEDAAALARIKVIPSPIRDASGIEQAIDVLAHETGGGLIVLPDVTTGTNRAQIVTIAARHKLPAVYPFRYVTAEGGLASYGEDVSDLYRRAAAYVDRILRGESPRDLPVQAPTKFDLVINLKTAKALGLVVPPALISRADEVIE